MFDDFLVRAVLAAVGLSLATGPLGAFVVWRKMAYFGDTIAHAAILGVAISLIISLPLFFGTMLVALGVGILASRIAISGTPMDAALGVLAHSALALGLVAISFVRGVNIDLNALLFGDILTVSSVNLVVIWLVSLMVLVLVAWRWSRLLMVTLNEDIAISVGISPVLERHLLTLALAAVVAVSIKIVGALLIGALLIIPAAAARVFAKTPEAMAAVAIAIGVVSGLGGVGFSLISDAPTGPSIVVVSALIFGAANWYANVQR